MLSYSQKSSTPRIVSKLRLISNTESTIRQRGATYLQVNNKCSIVCSVVIRATNASSSLEGVQKIDGLWRLYFKDRTTRLQLCNKQQLLINGVNVPLYDSNPYTSGHSIVHSLNGAHTPSNDKLTIKDIPLSVSNDATKQMLEEKGVKLVSSMKYGLIRDQNSQLTTYKSGDRFVYI